MSVTVTIKGLDKLDAALTALPDAMRAAPVRAGLKAVGQYGAEGMARRAPRDPDVSGVTLADEMVYDVKVSTSKDIALVQIGPSRRAWYAVFQEFGTAKRKDQAFMRPTLDMDGQQWVAVLAVHMRAGIERAVKRVAKLTRVA